MTHSHTPTAPSHVKSRVAKSCICCGSTALKAQSAILMPFVAHRVFGWEPTQIDESWGLRSVPSGHAYSLCRSLYCTECTFLFLDIRFTDEEMSDLYRGYRGDEYTKLRDRYEPGYAETNRQLNIGIGYIPQIEAFLTPFLPAVFDVLDWGGDTGRNTPFKERASAIHIYDISSKPVIAGASVVTREEAGSRSYPLIVCSNVLEHVPYPAETLLDIRDSMAPGSILYVEVPHEAIVRDSVDDLHLRKRYWHEHINFFSEQSMTALARSVGIRVIASNKLDAEAGGKSVSLLQFACRLD